MTRFVLPQLASGWIALPLGEVAEIKYGSALTASSRATNGDVPVYGSGGVVGSHDEALHSKVSIVVGRKGSVGSVFLTDGPFWCIDTAYYLDNLHAAVSIEYLSEYLQFIGLSRLAISVAVPGLNRKELALVPVPLPTLPEQRRIVDLLRQADTSSRVHDRRDHLDQLIKAALDQLVLGCDESEWEQLGSLVDTRYGTSVSADANADTGVPVLRIPNVMGGEVDTADMKYVELTQSELGRLRLTTADVLIVRSNGNPEYVGRSAPITEDVCQSLIVYASYLIRLRTDAARLLPEFLSAFLNSAFGRAAMRNAIRTTAGQSNLSGENLAKLRMPVPNIESQRRFRRLWLQVREVRRLVTQSEEAAKALRSALSINALSGDLTAQWREHHAAELAEAALTRDDLLRKRGAKITPSTTVTATPSGQADLTVRPARHWLLGELSDFQRQVLAAFTTYCQASGEPLLVEDPDVFARFCDDTAVIERLQVFGTSHGNRIRRSLSQLAALGLIAKVTLPKVDPESGEPDYLKAFRPLREDEFTRLADVQVLRKSLSPETDAEAS